MAFNPSTRTHPGRIVAKSLEREGMSQKSLSARTGISEKHLSHIINGEASITVETALLLETALGGSASFWMNLEQNYREALAREEREKLLKNEVSIVGRFPYAELAKLNLVESTRDSVRRVENLWKFFGVNSLQYVQDTEAVAYRRRDGNNIRSEWIAAWLRCGEIASREFAVGEFALSRLRRSLPGLRSLTNEKPEIFSRRAPELLRDAGVVLVYVPHFKGVGVSAAVRWVGDRPLIQMSLLGKYADIFWFNLFHEVGHILLHSKKEKFVEYDRTELSPDKEKEREADEFSSDFLIPAREYAVFLDSRDFSKVAVSRFADRIEIHPGIVEGRLCHDGVIGWNNTLNFRTRLKFEGARNDEV